MFWTLVIAIGLAWAVQSFLSFKQTQSFAKLFVVLRRQGRVALGKFRGGLTQGAIVMFVLDDEGVIRAGHRLNGVTVLARFREFTEYDGQRLDDIDPAAAGAYGRSVLRAVSNARDNYLTVLDGGEPGEPPTALARTVNAISGAAGAWRRRRSGTAAIR